MFKSMTHLLEKFLKLTGKITQNIISLPLSAIQLVFVKLNNGNIYATNGFRIT